MFVINSRNVHEALPEAIKLLYSIGYRRESRYGPVLVAPAPVATCYQCPLERVVLYPERDINPFATFFEGLWMLAGRNDVAYPAQYLPRMREFSDDGKTLHAAYGYRWRKQWGFDQMKAIGDALKANHEDRRQVLMMWSPDLDLVDQAGKKDLPCNTQVHFQVGVHGCLDITVTNRSNDIVWGTYGADAPHFSMLLEYMALRVGVPPGRYWQVSSNWHGYLKTLEPLAWLAERAVEPFAAKAVALSPYAAGLASHFPMGMLPGDGAAFDPALFDQELAMMLDVGPALGYHLPYFRRVALPMLECWRRYKEGDLEDARDYAIQKLAAEDLKSAVADWLLRRIRSREEKALVDISN